ncbi:MAG: HEAT repeat domain-containing protein [Polyangiaceae bacterium]
MRAKLLFNRALMVLVLAGCASAPGLGAAERGDYPSLEKDLTPDYASGKLTNDEAARVARAVASYEIAKAAGDEGRTRVHELAACAQELDGPLSDRMKTRDAIGAEAAMARLDSGELSTGDARDYVGDKDDAWRAIGARGLVEDDDVAAREKAFVDPSPLVRRSAFRAAAQAADTHDVAALVEAARLDPDDLARTNAVRAMARIGGKNVVDSLRDVWTHADEPLKDDIALAWSAPQSYDVGGREELRILIAQEKGAGVIAAAGSVAREHAQDGEMRLSALALLSRVIERGTERERLEALAISPLVPELMDSVHHASIDTGDSSVRIAALGRLLEKDHERAAAITMLEAFAGQHDENASRARLILAEAGDTRIQAWIEADLHAASPRDRIGAATALAAAGRSARGALLLADADPEVRTRVSCTLLAAARMHR